MGKNAFIELPNKHPFLSYGPIAGRISFFSIPVFLVGPVIQAPSAT
jgi:hypothetical protein